MLVEVLKGRGCLWVSAFDRPSFIVHLMDNMTKDYAFTRFGGQSKPQSGCNGFV